MISTFEINFFSSIMLLAYGLRILLKGLKQFPIESVDMVLYLFITLVLQLKITVIRSFNSFMT